MEEIDITKVSNAAALLIIHKDKLGPLKNYFTTEGLSDREINLAEAVAIKNLFYLTFCRRWDSEGALKVVPEILPEA